MGKKKLGKEEVKRAEIWELINCLDSNKLPSPDVSASISSRLQQYMEYELDNITDVLCKREDRNIQIGMELGSLADFVIYEYGETSGEKVSSALMSDIFEILEKISVDGIDDIQNLIEEYALDEVPRDNKDKNLETKDIFTRFYNELESDRQNNEYLKGDISASTWKKSYYKLKQALK